MGKGKSKPFTEKQYVAWIKLTPASRRHVNCLRFGVNETLAHSYTKLKLAREKIREGKLVVTEAVFEGNLGRCDVFCLDEQICYEIIDSESKKSIQNKSLKYPFPIKTINAQITSLTNFPRV